MDTPAPTTGRTWTRFYVVRCHHTDHGMLSVYAERDEAGQPRPHGRKWAAFAAAGLLGGRAAGFRVMETHANDNGEVFDVLFPRGDNA